MWKILQHHVNEDYFFKNSRNNEGICGALADPVVAYSGRNLCAVCVGGKWVCDGGKWEAGGGEEEEEEQLRQKSNNPNLKGGEKRSFS